MDPVLEIKDLNIGFSQDGLMQQVGDNISFTLNRGETTALVGESGSGKSITALSILQLLPKEARVSGQIIYHQGQNEKVNLVTASSPYMRSVRGNKIAMIFQEPMTSLNPVFTCGQQVQEVLQHHKKIRKKDAARQVIELFSLVDLPDPASMVNRYPHQISGGQKQRVMIAIAMSCQPDILIADEPTTALDVRVQANILELLSSLQKKTGLGILFITHDLGLVADFADNVAVMHKGRIVEQGATEAILRNPQNAYTQALLACRPAAGIKGQRLSLLSDYQPPASTTGHKPIQPVAFYNDTPILSVQNLVVQFPARSNFLGKTLSWVRAVDEVTFEVKKHEIVGLVGESGCGKTTLGRAILQLAKPASGKIILNGINIAALSDRALRAERKNLQIIFQDPYGSLNPRLTIGSAIAEALQVHGLASGKRQRQERVVSLLEKVNMLPDHVNRYPHQFSGGQRQRICIARALALDPAFVVFDESVSALDVSVQAQVLNLISDLRSSGELTAIFISHDLSVVHYLCDRIMVMHKGKIVESGAAEQVYNQPLMHYTRELIEAIPGKGLTGQTRQ